jgi:hypothetical protein
MRKAIGIVFVALGAIGLSICGIVLLRLPPPIPGFLLQRMGTFSLMIVLAPVKCTGPTIHGAEITIDTAPS